MTDKIRYYETLHDDFFESGEDFKLPEDYMWVRRELPFRILSSLVYSAAVAFGVIYGRLALHIRIKGARKLGQVDGGLFLYGNHTQPVGDVFDPALACFPKRIYTVVSPANFGLPVIGKILPYLGALPVSDTLHGMKELSRAIETRISEGHPIIIYPEAHVWEYYTGIRPFPESSFKYPLKTKAPVFCFTSTYQKRRFFKKPALVMYIDGPFFPKGDNPKERAKSLRDAVYIKMEERSRLSDCEYIKYRRKK